MQNFAVRDLVTFKHATMTETKVFDTAAYIKVKKVKVGAYATSACGLGAHLRLFVP